MDRRNKASVTVKIERYEGLKDLYRNFETRKGAERFLDSLLLAMEEKSLIRMEFSYRGDKACDRVTEVHVFDSSLVKDIQLVIVDRGDEL